MRVRTSLYISRIWLVDIFYCFLLVSLPGWWLHRQQLHHSRLLRHHVDELRIDHVDDIDITFQESIDGHLSNSRSIGQRGFIAIVRELCKHRQPRTNDKITSLAAHRDEIQTWLLATLLCQPVLLLLHGCKCPAVDIAR